VIVFLLIVLLTRKFVMASLFTDEQIKYSFLRNYNHTIHLDLVHNSGFDQVAAVVMRIH